MINPIIQKFVPLVDLLADLFGNNCEVVLHDIKNPERSIIKIRNGHITSRKRGGPITDLGLKMIKDNKPETILYTEKTKEGRTLRCAGLVIRDESKKIAGYLCINLDISSSSIWDTQNQITHSGSDRKGDFNHLEHFEMNIKSLIRANINEIMKNIYSNKRFEELTKDEKLEILKRLNSKGIFLLKGAVKEIAEILSVSSVSIYKYLEEIR
jgi:predicted transcriptional regulator YheO